MILVQPASPTAWLTIHLIPGSSRVDISVVSDLAICSMCVLDHLKLPPSSPPTVRVRGSRSFAASNPNEISAVTSVVVDLLVVIEVLIVYFTVKFVVSPLQ